MTTHDLHVIFGTGPLGKWTARELVRMGKRVRMINRSGRAADVPPAVEVLSGDAYDRGLNVRQTEGAAAVYQCAQPEYHRWGEQFMRLQSAILDAAAANGAKFIAAENVYMYGEPRGEPLTESAPYAPRTRKGQVRRAMTEAVFATHAAGRVRAAAVRGSDFFGPDDRIYGENVFQAALLGKTVNALGRLDQPHTWTYVADFGKALAIAGTREQALGRAWHAPSDAPITQRQLADLIAQEIGRPVRVAASGKLLLTLLGMFNKTLAEMPEMMYEFERPFVVDSSEFTRTFGMVATPIRDAIGQTVAWNRQALAARLDRGAVAEPA